MNSIKINGIYRHFKGNKYLLCDVATNADTGEKFAVYRALYGECGLWIRPLDEFLSEVDRIKYPSANQKYRFELQDVKDEVKR